LRSAVAAAPALRSRTFVARGAGATPLPCPAEVCCEPGQRSHTIIVVFEQSTKPGNAMRYIVPLLFLANVVIPVRADTEPKKEATSRYEWKSNHDPDGIGKFYMGREIAQVMGHLGASWLERPEREKEENPAKLLKALKIEPGMAVADIGAGSGYYTFRMAPLAGSKGKIYAVDIQKEMLKIIKDRCAKDKVENVETVLGEEADPKLPVGGIDVILLVDVYHEFAKPYEMTEKLVKSLKPGGRLVFVEFRKEDAKVPIKEVHKMTERQVLKEMGEFKELKHAETNSDLPWQHVITFKKTEAKKK
jgi:ubiquinone/menaquinone biosynthesis C-methylase UbiE